MDRMRIKIGFELRIGEGTNARCVRDQRCPWVLEVERI